MYMAFYVHAMSHLCRWRDTRDHIHSSQKNIYVKKQMAKREQTEVNRTLQWTQDDRGNFVSKTMFSRGAHGRQEKQYDEKCVKENENVVFFHVSERKELDHDNDGTDGSKNGKLMTTTTKVKVTDVPSYRWNGAL